MRIFSPHGLQECVKRLGSPAEEGVPQEWARAAAFVRGRWFMVTILPEEGFARRLQPFNRAVGLLSEQGGKTTATFVAFMGRTDPLSLLIYFALACIVFFVYSTRNGYSAGQCFALAAVWTAVLTAFTFFVTLLSKKGRYGNKALRAFIAFKLEADND